MKIGIDAYPLARNGAGISNYLYYMVKHLEKLDPDNEYFLFSCPGIKMPFGSNGRWHVRIKEGILNKSATIWMQTLAKKDLARDKVDIFWSPEQIGPIDLSKKIKVIVTVHDLSWYFYPQAMSMHNLILHRLFFRKSINRANFILTDCLSVADDLLRNFPEMRREQVKTLYAALREDIFPIDKKNAQHYVLSKFNLSKKYILFVGTIEPRKNIENLIRAYYMLDDSFKRNYTLLIVGRPGWKVDKVFSLSKELKLDDSQLRFLGYVQREDLVNLYSAAELLALPSFYEGFGMPLLEAMKCKIPIICSDIPVFREIAGESAYFVDPKNVKAFSQGMRKVLEDSQLSGRLISRGLEQNNLYSWERSAKELIRIFNNS